MNKIEDLCFQTMSLGKVKLLALIGNNALIERLDNNPEKYIVANGFDMQNKTWTFGCYYRSFKQAMKEYANESIKLKSDELNKSIDYDKFSYQEQEKKKKKYKGELNGLKN